MADTANPILALLDAARLLASPGVRSLALRVVTAEGTLRLRVTTKPASAAPAAPQVHGAADPRHHVKDAILAVLQTAEQPLPPKRLATLTGKYRANTYFGEALGELRSDGTVKRIKGGTYWLSSRPLPAE